MSSVVVRPEPPRSAIQLLVAVLAPVIILVLLVARLGTGGVLWAAVLGVLATVVWLADALLRERLGRRTELVLLGWTVVLGLVQLLIAAMMTTQQTGLAWAAGPRDEPRQPEGIAARLRRAQSNLMETFPFFAAAILACHVAGRESGLSLMGAELYFWARLLYVPLYAVGVPFLRSIAWSVSLAGLVMVLVALLR